MLSQHSVYHNLLCGFSYFFSLCIHACIHWAFRALASQLSPLPEVCSARCPSRCSCEPCYFWLLSYVLVWIHNLSLISSLECLYCYSSEARVIQFLGNSHYLSLWILPVLPYFRIIFIRVIFYWVDVLIKIFFLNITTTSPATQHYIVCLDHGLATYTHCNRLTVSEGSLIWKIHSVRNEVVLNLNNSVQRGWDQSRMLRLLSTANRVLVWSHWSVLTPGVQSQHGSVDAQTPLKWRIILHLLALQFPPDVVYDHAIFINLEIFFFVSHTTTYSLVLHFL